MRGKLLHELKLLALVRATVSGLGIDYWVRDMVKFRVQNIFCNVLSGFFDQ